MFKDLYHLTKPGIVYGNILTTVAAYLYASRWQFSIEQFLATVVGLGLVIASACVFNNYLDRDIDAKMERTKQRALASGTISPASALAFGSALGIIGSALLAILVDSLATLVALAGFLVYVLAYTFAKRSTEWASEIGSLAGATPIVVGYVAVTDRFDIAALILFLILALWQMPHFYAIAIFRAKEYQAAGIPVLPLKRGTRVAKRRMLAYIAAFIVALAALTAYGYAGYTYLVVTCGIGMFWLWRSTQGSSASEEGMWARQLFFVSLIVLLAFSVMLSVAQLLP